MPIVSLSILEGNLEVIQHGLAPLLSHSYHRHGNTSIALAEYTSRGLADTLFRWPILILPPPGKEKAL